MQKGCTWKHIQCNPDSWEVESKGHTFETSLNYIARPCLVTKQNECKYNQNIWDI